MRFGSRRDGSSGEGERDRDRARDRDRDTETNTERGRAVDDEKSDRHSVLRHHSEGQRLRMHANYEIVCDPEVESRSGGDGGGRTVAGPGGFDCEEEGEAEEEKDGEWRFCPTISPIDIILDSDNDNGQTMLNVGSSQQQIVQREGFQGIDIFRRDSLDNDMMMQSLQKLLLAHIATKKSSQLPISETPVNMPVTTNDEGNICKPDETSILQSPLIELGGGCSEYFLTFNVLIFLNAEDLCRLSMVSRYFDTLCKSSHLWNLAYKRDFVADIDFDTWKVGTIAKPPLSRLFTRAKYLERYKDHYLRVDRGKESKKQMVRDVVRLEKMDMIEQILDFIQVRTLAPVGMLSIFLSVVLFCQWEDGLNIPLWSCGIPIVFSLCYLMIALYIIYKVHETQYSMDHILRGFWGNMSGPLVNFYQEAMNESSRLFYFVQGIVAMMIIQIGLVVIKLTSATPDAFDRQLSWGIVFIPIWLLFLIFCVSPCTQFRLSIGTYLFIFFIFWVPLFILFACLTQKLDNNRSLRMSYILIPFYVIEGTVMLSSLIFLITGIISYRRGYLERIDDYLAIFFLSWITLSPLVTFQSLLAARDDNQIAHNHSFPSATEVATPLLIMQGWMTLVVTYACLTYKTGFENVRASRLQDSAGLRVIYKV